jgi:hypothetical protein
LAEVFIRRFGILVLGVVVFVVGMVAVGQIKAPPPPAAVASHPTQVEARVKSVRLLKKLVEVAEAAGGEDSTADVKVYVVVLEVQKARPVTPDDLMSVQAGTTVDAATREAIDKSFVGKKIKGVLELKGDTQQRRFFLSQIKFLDSKHPKRAPSNQEKK